MLITCTINGKRITLDVPSDRRFVDILREDLGLTGTKEACGAGECGSCTILVNGESKLSCLMVAAQLDGADIITIEGFSPDELHPIQEAFIEQGAIQCGFCTPGMVLAAADLLRRIPHPSREEIRAGISGNLCRCTGYQKIVDAIASVRLKQDNHE